MILGRVKSDVPKQVMFSDGIRPGGDLADLDGSSERIIPTRRLSRSLKKLSPTINSKSYKVYPKFIILMMKQIKTVVLFFMIRMLKYYE